MYEVAGSGDPNSVMVLEINYCQAQPMLQVNLSLNADLALFSLDLPTRPGNSLA